VNIFNRWSPLADNYKADLKTIVFWFFSIICYSFFSYHIKRSSVNVLVCYSHIPLISLVLIVSDSEVFFASINKSDSIKTQVMALHSNIHAGWGSGLLGRASAYAQYPSIGLNKDGESCANLDLHQLMHVTLNRLHQLVRLTCLTVGFTNHSESTNTHTQNHHRKIKN
jgi:hypothetical protein